MEKHLKKYAAPSASVCSIFIEESLSSSSVSTIKTALNDDSAITDEWMQDLPQEEVLTWFND